MDAGATCPACVVLASGSRVESLAMLRLRLDWPFRTVRWSWIILGQCFTYATLELDDHTVGHSAHRPIWPLR
eukprot:SAG22_NODE_18984_length_279_cov_0.666667_1_plen_71_part_01